jgi:hypothetical protein
MLKNDQALKWIFRLGIINTILIIYLRMGLIYQPLLFNFYYETHGNKEWAMAIKEEVGSKPVVFENSYRNAPMYSFYTNGIPTFSLNNFMYRKNQYSIDDSEEVIRGKDVAYISKYINDDSFTIEKENGGFYKGKYIDDFQSFRRLECIIEEVKIGLNSNDVIPLEVYNPYPEAIDLQNLKFAVTYLDPYKTPVQTLPITISPLKTDTQTLLPKDTTNFRFKLPKTDLKDLGFFRVVISENNLYYGLNGKPIPLE